MNLLRFRLLLALLGLPGCLATMSDVDGVSQRVGELERVNSTVMAEASAATKRLENLNGQVEDANNQLREVLAKANARIAEGDRSLQKLRGDLEVIVHRLDALERIGTSSQQSVVEVRGRLNQLIADLRDRAGIAVLALPAELPTDADGFVKAADRAFQDGDVRLAAALAAECQKRYPATEQWASCGLIPGKIAAQEQRYVDALRLFQAVHDGLNGKPVAPVAQSLVEVARILEAEGKCGKAAQVWTYLATEMPKVPQAKLAKAEPAMIAKRCKEGTGVVEKPPEKPAEKTSEPKAVEPPAGVTPAAGRAEKTDLLEESANPAPAKPAPAKAAPAKPIAAPAKPPAAPANPPAAPVAPKPAPAAKPAPVAPKPAAKPAVPAAAPAKPK